MGEDSKNKQQRPREDNVIYANFGAKRREQAPAQTVRRAAADGTHLPPAARRVLLAALRQADDGRVQRGEAYARKGHVIELVPRPGGLDALVEGTQNEPFSTGLNLPRRNVAELESVYSYLASTPGSIMRARNGQLDDVVLDMLLAPAPEDIRFYCTCPDPVVVCKHAVAVAHQAAELMSADPTVVFSMRNVRLEVLERRVRAAASSLAEENAEEGSEFFWSGRQFPQLPAPKVAPMIADSDLELLHKAMQTVSFTNIDQLRAVADIEDLYDAMTRL